MPLRPISSGRIAAGQLWTAELTFDFMERTWQAFEIPFDFQMDSFSATAATPAPNTGTATHDVYGVFPESYDLDDNFAEGMYVELNLHLYLTHISGGIATVAFTGETGSGGSTSKWVKIRKTWSSSLPTGLQTLELTLTVNAAAVPSPEIGDASVARSWGGGPDSYLRIVIPDAGGVDTDDMIIYVGDESELPTPSETWRHAEARLKAPAGAQDTVWRCLKGYDDLYYWVPFVHGGGGL